MTTLKECENLTDAVPLFPRRNLYLKPIAKLLISVQLPHFKKLIGKSVSTLEVLEKLKELIKPYEFAHTKVVTSTISVIEFEVEADTKSKVKDILRKTDNNVLKLKNFKDVCKITASECKQNFPSEEEWNHFFSHSNEMDEAKPGERPDTVYFSGLPISWFSRATDEKRPSERLFSELFQQFGKIRTVDIPMCDPYRSKMKKYLTGMNTCSFGEKDFFEGYVQFYDYCGFVKTMDAFRGMQLVRKEGDSACAVDIRVDFDKSKHLSLGFIKRREILCERLRQRETEKKEEEQQESAPVFNAQPQQNSGQTDVINDKETRKKLREERRKARLLNKLKDKNSDEMNEKIAREEWKILKAQRMLESIRLIEALFRRIKNMDIKNKSIQNIIKEKRSLMRTTAVTWSDDDDESSSSSSDQEGREFSDPSASSANFNKYGWYPPPFLGGTYLHPNQRLLNYPLLQQEEYVKCFSKFLYNRGNRPPARGRGRRYFRPRSPGYRRRSRSRSRSRKNSSSWRSNKRSRSRSSERRSRGRSWSTTSGSSASSRRRRSRSRSRRKD